MVLGREDDEWWNRPPSSVDSLDDSHPLTVAWLYRLWSIAPLRACNNELSQYLAHHKASLVEVVGIFVKDAVLLLRTLYKLKPLAKDLRILTQGPLAIIRSIQLSFKLRSPPNKVPWPMRANLASSALSKQFIGHIPHCIQRRRKVSRV